MQRRNFQVPRNKWNDNLNVILNLSGLEITYGNFVLLYSLFSFFYLEMVVFKDVFILSRTFIENLPCAILEEGMATRCSFLAWKVPWTEEPSGLQAIGS